MDFIHKSNCHQFPNPFHYLVYQHGAISKGFNFTSYVQLRSKFDFFRIKYFTCCNFRRPFSMNPINDLKEEKILACDSKLISFSDQIIRLLH